MIVASGRDLDGLRRAGAAVSAVIRQMALELRPGITTAALDDVGARALREQGARSAPRLVYDFPGATCISVNHEVAHGIPGPRILCEGDTVNIDVSAELDGYFADAGVTLALGKVDERRLAVCRCARRALEQAIAVVRDGVRIHEIGRAIEGAAGKAGYTVIRNLCGHGVGRGLHEEPEHIRNYYHPSDRRLLREGMVLAIEPFITESEECVVDAGDGWTLLTPERSFVAQYEHTVVVTRGEPVIVTDFGTDDFPPRL